MPTLQKRDVKGNPYCDFCATMRFERCQIFDRCVRYNAQAHVKTGRAFTAVRIINYISDKRKWVVEKQSKSFSQLRFCPVCGFDYVPLFPAYKMSAQHILYACPHKALLHPLRNCR